MFDTLKQQIAGYILGGALITAAIGITYNKEKPEGPSITIQSEGQTYTWPVRDPQGEHESAKQQLTTLLFETERAYGRQLTANKQKFILYYIDGKEEYDRPHKGTIVTSEITRHTPQKLADIIKAEYGP